MTKCGFGSTFGKGGFGSTFGKGGKIKLIQINNYLNQLNATQQTIQQ